MYYYKHYSTVRGTPDNILIFSTIIQLIQSFISKNTKAVTF